MLISLYLHISPYMLFAKPSYRGISRNRLNYPLRPAAALRTSIIAPLRLIIFQEKQF
jgi:hypothetical protein